MWHSQRSDCWIYQGFVQRQDLDSPVVEDCGKLIGAEIPLDVEGLTVSYSVVLLMREEREASVAQHLRHEIRFEKDIGYRTLGYLVRRGNFVKEGSALSVR